MTTGNPGIIWTILSFLVVIGPLIFIHELGHYFVGRWFGVKAETFSIGFGKELFGWTDRRGTRWKVSALPLGGYVKFAGDMNPASQGSPEWVLLPAEERARTFQAKPVWQRFLIVLAGPATNFLVGILIVAGFAWHYGDRATPPVVAAVEPGSAAASAGVLPGDRVRSVDGTSVARFEDIYPAIVLRAGDRVPLGIERAGRAITLPVTVGTAEVRDKFGNSGKVGRLGISTPTPVIRAISLPEALGVGVTETRRIVSLTVNGLGQMIAGKRSLKELGGPLKIAKYSGEQASLGWLTLIGFMAAISINLGFINLLPIPMLDGGHLLFYAIEAVRREPLKPEAQEWAFRTGLAALLALMIFVTVNDLASFGLWAKLGGLIG
ncbi:MAG: RIP metalloprotease RseP [Allosphingosinicella sp.]